MHVTVERLRIGIVVLAILLVITILLFFGSARFARRHLVHDLPARLGVHIQSSAEGFTFSKSDKGRTLFTLHASKVVQYQGGGRATLHDVSIILYGKQGSREDRISGADFEYDPVSGIARAAGDVVLDLQAPDSGSSGNVAAPGSDQGKSTIHVKTSGLIFDQNTGIASTDKAVEFRFPQATGRATGARYDSQKGELVLMSEVEMSRSMNGEQFQLHSGHAQFLRDERLAMLANVVTEYRQNRSDADNVILYFRRDGSVDHADARGNVHLTSDDGRELTAQSGSMSLDPNGQPLRARLAGGVLFHSEDAQRNMRATAGEGTVEFGTRGTLRHAQMRRSVTFVDQQLKLPDDPHGSATREIHAAKLDLDFTTDAERHSSPTNALATGDAVVVLRSVGSKAPRQNATVEGDTLYANMSEGMTLTSLEGKGHTRLTDVSADGTTQISTGDTLLVKFNKATKKHEPSLKKIAGPTAKMPATQSSAIEIQSALQQGNVTLTQTPAKQQAKTAVESVLTARAQRALYTGSDQVLRLDGSPRISNGNLEISAQTFEVTRSSGDAIAQGDVKATYLQVSGGAPLVFGGQDPVHIVSERANLQRSSGDAVFRGQARLWQGANSIAAPVIELSRTQQTLKAHGDAPIRRAIVNAVFLSPSGTGKQQEVVRLESQQLVYSDAERKALFRGMVVAEDASGTIRSDETVLVLAPAGQASGNRQATGQKSTGVQGQVDHLVASGHVSMVQADRKGTGEKLVYTAQSGLFVLSGTATAPPRLVDPQRGTVTGDALIFNSRDDSVSVSGGKSGAITETRVPR